MWETSGIFQLVVIVSILLSAILIIPMLMLLSAPSGGPDVDDAN